MCPCFMEKVFIYINLIILISETDLVLLFNTCYNNLFLVITW